MTFPKAPGHTSNSVIINATEPGFIFKINQNLRKGETLCILVYS